MNISQYFDGEWTVSRRLDDAHFFSGTASFVPADGGLLQYVEHGTVQHPQGFTGPAHREYYFALAEDDSTFSVYFDQSAQALFHTIALTQNDRGLYGRADHLCVNDTYASEYWLMPNGHWVWSHRVTGPKKDYFLESRYEPRT